LTFQFNHPVDGPPSVAAVLLITLCGFPSKPEAFVSLSTSKLKSYIPYQCSGGGEKEEEEEGRRGGSNKSLDQKVSTYYCSNKPVTRTTGSGFPERVWARRDIIGEKESRHHPVLQGHHVGSSLSSVSKNHLILIQST
jgi:hypothetical protein